MRQNKHNEKRNKISWQELQAGEIDTKLFLPAQPSAVGSCGKNWDKEQM